jgi:predicted MFS family arabinose efflux permease
MKRVFVDASPLRESRDFRVVWLSQLLSWTGRQIVIVAVPYQVYVLTRSSLAVGLVGAFQLLPIIVAGLYGGALADRLDRRQVQLVGKTLLATGSLALALGAIAHRTPVGFIYAVAALTAGVSAVDQAARSATVPRLVPRHLLSSAISLSQITFQAAAVVGPAAAGLVIGTAGVTWAYVIDVLAFLPAFALIWQLAPQPPQDRGSVLIGWRTPADAIRYVRHNRLVLGLFSSDLVAMIFGMPTAVFPALALSVFRFGATGLGLMYAAPAAGALLGAVFSGWLQRVSRQGLAIFVAIALWGLAIAGFGLVGKTLWIGLPLLAAAGGADMVSAIFRSTVLQLSIPDSMRGRMSAFHSMVTTTGPRLGDLEAGAVAALVNPIFSVVSGGILCVVGIALLATLLPEMRHQRAGQEEPVRPPATPE